jgi:DNA invertase Pin-like site-specific DNA recombinase
MPPYVIYARKSTESEDRQVLSIDSQVRELSTIAHEQGHQVTGVLTESRSAKSPGRQVFGQLLRSVSQGKVQGVLSWKLDRLARNPVDGAALIWALEQGRLREVITPQRTFTNNGNDKFWMQLEFGMAKKYIDDLSDNVKRGNRAKLEQGWLPGRPPLGYLNDREAKTIIPDPDRFPLLRKAFEHVLSGYSPAEVLRLLNDKWGFRTRIFRRGGGNALYPSHFYRILSNPFYCGLLVHNGDTYIGSHEPLLSQDEFDEVQHLLGRPNRAHTHRRLFAYTGLIHCGECGASVTAEHKVNRYGSAYTYYHCTKRKRTVRCSQKTVELGVLESQILGYLRNLTISDDIADWALQKVRAFRSESAGTRTSLLRSLATTEVGLRTQRNQLTDLRIRGLISDEEFSVKRGELVAQELRLRQHREKAAHDGAGWLELFEKAILFANQAEKRFAAVDPTDRREIVMAVGSNLTLRDRLLSIDVRKPLSLVVEGTRNSRWQGLEDGIRTFLASGDTFVPWPRWCL